MAERFIPSDSKAWGRLVKAWTKGITPHPTTLAELSEQMIAAGMEPPDLPPFITELAVVQKPKHVLTIRLPAKELVEASEAKIASGGPGEYPLPRFYDEFFKDGTRDTELTQEERLALNDQRLGEYSMNSCK